MTMTINISIDAGIINAALCAVSSAETRYYLRGVFIDARGFVAATNGHILFAAQCAGIGDKLADVKSAAVTHAMPGVIVPTEAWAQANKAAGKSKGLCYVLERDAQGMWWILYGNARIHFTPIDGSFPEWRRVVPERADTLIAAHYNPVYMTALGNMSKALRNGKKDDNTGFRLHQAGDAPALATFINPDGDTRIDCLAVLMPMRTKPADYGAGATSHTIAFRL
jgi:hypothetical protein